MRKVWFVIALVTAFVTCYQASPYIGVSDKVILAMFLAAPFLLLYMVYVILKYGEPSGKTFDEQFYDDLDAKE